MQLESDTLSRNSSCTLRTPNNTRMTSLRRIIRADVCVYIYICMHIHPSSQPASQPAILHACTYIYIYIHIHIHIYIYLGNPYAFYKCRRRAETPFAGRRRDYKLVCGTWNLEAFLDLWPVAALSGLSSGCPVPSRGVPSCLLHSSSCLRELLDREKQGTRIH